MRYGIVVLPVLVAATSHCGSGIYTMVPPGVQRTETVVSRVMRGATREGCSVDDFYDDIIGLMISCEDGRVVAGHPSGTNMDLPGKPLEVSCSRGMGSEEDCKATWKRIYEAGAAPCKEGDSGPGCGPLQCSVSPGGGGGGSCEQALDPYSEKFCPECDH